MNFKFSVRGPDRISEEIAAILSTKRELEFKELFDIVAANFRAKNFARNGDEMLRLRAYEKLQDFLAAGIVTKDSKKYKGVPKMLKEFLTTAAEFNARFAAGTHHHPRVAPNTPKAPEPKALEVKAPKPARKAAAPKTPARAAKKKLAAV